MHRQRADGHAGLLAGVLDQRGQHALLQQRHALVGVGHEHAAGVEAAAVVHHDRRLADLLHVVERAGERPRREVFLPRITSTSGILSTGEKKCRPMKLAGPLRRLGQPGDRQRGGVGGEDGGLRDHGLGLPRDVGLDVPALEDRLDHQFAALEVGVVRRRMDAREDGLHLGRRPCGPGPPASAAASGSSPCPCRRPRVVLSSSTTSMPGAGRHVGDARAHHAGAEHAEARDAAISRRPPDGAPACRPRPC